MECPVCLCNIPNNEQIQFGCGHYVCMNCCMKMVSLLPYDAVDCACPLCRTKDKIPVDIYHCVISECFDRTSTINNEEDVNLRQQDFKDYMKFILDNKWVLFCVKNMKAIIIKKCKKINDDDSLLLAAQFDSIEI